MSVTIGAHRWLERCHPHRHGWTTRLSLECVEIDAWIRYLRQLEVRSAAQEKKLHWCMALDDAIRARDFGSVVEAPPALPRYPSSEIRPLLNSPRLEGWIYENYDI